MKHVVQQNTGKKKLIIYNTQYKSKKNKYVDIKLHCTKKKNKKKKKNLKIYSVLLSLLLHLSVVLVSNTNS